MREQRLVLTDSHLSATDADTLLAGVVDPSKITFRISDITGGKLQSRLSSSDVWEDMTLETDSVTSQEYYAFTFADLQAGKVSFLAGDGLQAGGGEQITFKVQAVDDNGNLSDSDDATPGDQAADGSVAVDRAAVATKAGVGVRINEDGVLSPDEATLTAWKQSATTHGGTLRVIVRLLDMQEGDVLSLQSGYDTSKITPDWDQDEGKSCLWRLRPERRKQRFKTALGTLSSWILSSSASVRQVWVFPIQSRGSLMFFIAWIRPQVWLRYYFYDITEVTITPTRKAAAERSLFGKQGYLGFPTSDAERSMYLRISENPGSIIHVGISDEVQEGKWLVTAGPRKGQLFWDHTNKQFGPGAAGSDWTKQDDFWSTGQPDDASGHHDTATLYYGDELRDGPYYRGGHFSHHDFRLVNGEVFMRPVEVGERRPTPFSRLISARCVRVPGSVWC